MYGKLGFKAARTGSGCSIIFSSDQIKLLSTTGYNYCNGTYLAAQQQEQTYTISNLC